MKTICFLILILKNYIDFACKWCRIVRVHVLLLSFVYRENSVNDRPRILLNRPCMVRDHSCIRILRVVCQQFDDVVTTVVIERERLFTHTTELITLASQSKLQT